MKKENRLGKSETGMKSTDINNGGGKYYICTSNISINPRKLWEKKGREVYDIGRIQEHAYWVNEIFHSLKIQKCTAGMRYGGRWFIDKKSFPRREERKGYLGGQGRKKNFSTFRGGISFSDYPTCFINLFLDHPWEEKGEDVVIDVPGMDLKIIFTHHLTVDFETSDLKIKKRIEVSAKRFGFHEIEKVPLVLCHKEVTAATWYGEISE